MQPKLDTLHAPWLRIPAWGAAMACLTAAERVFPLIDRLASARTKEYCRATLDEVWASSAGPPPRADAIASQIHGIDGLPESSEDDSHKAAYYAMRAIGLVWHAVRSQAPEAAHQEWRGALSGALSLAADLEVVAQRVATKKPGLRESEIAFQGQILRLIEQEPGLSTHLVTSLRVLGEGMATEFQSAVDDLCRLKGW